ncbi:hypothetical protein PRNP1_012407 [Phytophthora ramorum]
MKGVAEQEDQSTVNPCLSDVLFASLDISAQTKRTIVEDLKYERLTNVQNETFPLIIEGKDALAKAKTGHDPNSPTRELAQQIATEANRVTKFHELNVACFVGGANIKKDERTLTSSAPIDILVAIPGRLVDHLKQNTGRIADRLGKASVLILDEADRLLDMGFRPDGMRIIGYLPKQRQTLLFSATLPASTEELKRVALRWDYAFVDTIDETRTRRRSRSTLCAR